MRHGFPLLAAVASFACIGGASGGSPPDDPTKEEQPAHPADVESVVAPPGSEQAAEEFWTEDRMRKAKPLPTPVLDPKTMKPVTPADPSEPPKPE
jgi:hypothetical protein